MGYSLSRLAIKGKKPEPIRDALGLELTEEREEIPESAFCGAELPGGWYLVIADHTEQVATNEQMKIFSEDAELVTCYVEEHVMCSQVTGWKNTQQLWSITHASEKASRHLEIQGTPPECFVAHRDLLLQKQLEEDQKNDEFGVDYIFDIPIETAHSITGFRHDQDIPNAGENPFEVLAVRKAPSIFRRLFSK